MKRFFRKILTFIKKVISKSATVLALYILTILIFSQTVNDIPRKKIKSVNLVKLQTEKASALYAASFFDELLPVLTENDRKKKNDANNTLDKKIKEEMEKERDEVLSCLEKNDIHFCLKVQNIKDYTLLLYYQMVEENNSREKNMKDTINLENHDKEIIKCIKEKKESVMICALFNDYVSFITVEEKIANKQNKE